MKTTVRTIIAHVPAIAPEDDGIRKVKIATEHGDLMMNRLRRELRIAHDTAMRPLNQRVTIEPNNELLLQVADAYVKKSKAMKRMDKKLDEMRRENMDWEQLATDLYNTLIFMTSCAQDFFDVVSVTEGAGDELLAKIPKESDDLQEALSVAKGVIDLVEDDEDNSDYEQLILV